MSDTERERAKELVAEWTMDAERAMHVADALSEAADEHREKQYHCEDKARALTERLRQDRQ